MKNRSLVGIIIEEWGVGSRLIIGIAEVPVVVRRRQVKLSVFGSPTHYASIMAFSRVGFFQ